MGWMMMFGGLFFLFWLGVIFLVVWAVAKVASGGGSPSPRESPLDIAKRRYARGEISKEEFEELKRNLA